MSVGLRGILQSVRPGLIHLAVLAAAGVGVACASGGQSEGGASRSRDLITLEEIQGINASDAYDAVRRLRSTWLRSRQAGTGAAVAGDQSAGFPAVFVDNVRAGDIEMLRSIPIQNVLEIRRISGSDATTRWGTGYPNGVIEVITRR